jgi:hypothetical protein
MIGVAVPRPASGVRRLHPEHERLRRHHLVVAQQRHQPGGAPRLPTCRRIAISRERSESWSPNRIASPGCSMMRGRVARARTAPVPLGPLRGARQCCRRCRGGAGRCTGSSVDLSSVSRRVRSEYERHERAVHTPVRCPALGHPGGVSREPDPRAGPSRPPTPHRRRRGGRAGAQPHDLSRATGLTSALFDGAGICATIAIIGTARTLPVHEPGAAWRDVATTAYELSKELGGEHHYPQGFAALL